MHRGLSRGCRRLKIPSLEAQNSSARDGGEVKQPEARAWNAAFSQQLFLNHTNDFGRAQYGTKNSSPRLSVCCWMDSSGLIPNLKTEAVIVTEGRGPEGT